MAEAPPPPLQIDAQPLFIFLDFSAVINVPIIRAPDAPSGCPQRNRSTKNIHLLQRYTPDFH